uniref:Uncharacterized protein n=1 Tax=Timema shepardi TaxID=629360 RepID=A0A7R9FZ65_TIMSH|nr:unnamed protein product [Timema shepardi]
MRAMLGSLPHTARVLFPLSPYKHPAYLPTPPYSTSQFYHHGKVNPGLYGKEDHSKHSSTILVSGKTDDFSSAMASSSFSGGNRNPLLCVWLFLLLAWTCVGIEARTLSESKRSTTQAELGATDYPDYQTGVRYDEYPVNAALLRVVVREERDEGAWVSVLGVLHVLPIPQWARGLNVKLSYPGLLVMELELKYQHGD